MDNPFVNSGIVVVPSDWDMEFHTHPNSFEISVLLEGRGFFECLGVVYPIEAGHVVVIPANLAHSYRALTEMRFGVFEAGCLPGETNELFRWLSPSDRPSLLFLSLIALEQYEGLFRQFLRVVSGMMPDKTKTFKAWTEVLILFLLQHRSGGEGSNVSIVASADYIRENLRSELSIGTMARQCGLSQSAYRALFKVTFGYSPKKYQKTCRAAEAKWLLRTTDRPVQWIAEHVGFAAVHSFSAWFQKTEGVSPSEFRRRQQGL